MMSMRASGRCRGRWCRRGDRRLARRRLEVDRAHRDACGPTWILRLPRIGPVVTFSSVRAGASPMRLLFLRRCQPDQVRRVARCTCCSTSSRMPASSNRGSILSLVRGAAEGRLSAGGPCRKFDDRAMVEALYTPPENNRTAAQQFTQIATPSAGRRSKRTNNRGLPSRMRPVGWSKRAGLRCRTRVIHFAQRGRAGSGCFQQTLMTCSCRSPFTKPATSELAVTMGR
jgi:hypothetical protein